MVDYIIFFICAVAAYLIGSCNSAIIIIKLWKHDDIRNYGSKNAGLTNVLRCFGKGPALATLLCDLMKGLLTILIVKLILKYIGFSGDIMAAGYIIGLIVMLGHIFPLYYGFKGGKGVLLAATVLLAIDIRTFLIVFPIFVVVLYLSKYVSLSSMIAATAYPIVTFILQYFVRDDIEFKTALLHTALATLNTILIVYMHRENIKRLKSGTENKFSFSKNK